MRPSETWGDVSTGAPTIPRLRQLRTGLFRFIGQNTPSGSTNRKFGSQSRMLWNAGDGELEAVEVKFDLSAEGVVRFPFVVLFLQVGRTSL